MMMKRVLKMPLSLLGLIWLLTQPYHVLAQERLSGTILDGKDKSPIPGATIVAQGGSGKAISNEAGKFEISATKGQVLTISMIGYTTKSVKAGSGMTIELESSVVSLDEVTIGYGTRKKDLMTGSVATMTMDDTRRNSPTTSLANLLAGQMAGVNVATANARPGQAPSIVVRGMQKLSMFNDVNVLFVIDGLVTPNAEDFNNLSPNDIDNISVLKDAAASAAYGARASGGVIVVTTRRGSRNEKAKINYSFNSGFDKRGKNAALTSAIEVGQIFNRINPTASDIWTPADFEYFKNINNGYGYNQVDAVWQDPYTTTHNLSASGGGEKLSYFIGGSYVKQGAFQKNSIYQKYNIRANITADIAKNLSVFAGLTVNNNVTTRPAVTPGVVGEEADMYRKQLVWQPYQPVWTDGGQPIDYGWIGNVGAEIRGDAGYLNTHYLKPVINLKATYKVPFVEGLSLSSQYIKAFTNNRDKQFYKRYNMAVMKTVGTHQISTNDADVLTYKKSTQIPNSLIQEAYRWNEDAQLNFQLNYDHTFANVHHVQGWLAYERAENSGGGAVAGRRTFPVYETDQWWAASTDQLWQRADGDIQQTTGRKSYVGQFFYDYSGKYLANFTYRYDGSYKFAPDKRWGFFPSGSLGWVISRENFFTKVKGIEMLKIRGSVGTTSADNTDAWQYQQKYGVEGSSAYFGTTPVLNPAIVYGSLVNPDITWEKSINYNAAVDVNFLKHFNATAEYFYTKTYDILTKREAQVPPTFSRTLPASNYGAYNTKGLELTVGYRNSINKLNYYANVNASYSNATPLIKDKNITYPTDIEINQSISRQVGYVQTGFIRTQADLDAFVAAHPTYKFKGIAPALGQLTYADLSSKNGTPDGIVDEWDQKVIFKNTNPVVLGLNLGFEWKGISVDASFAGSLHNYKNTENLAEGVEWNRMWQPWADDAWTPENPNASLPKRYSSNDGTKNVVTSQSTFWWKKADYLRLRMLNVGYAIPAKITNKMGINGLKLYFSGSNLFVIGKFNNKYYDPQMGGGFDYPVMKTFNFGVNLSL
ncbi:SusC/RagA family TonB-linked outer membrane protein [Pedobacter sp. KBW06]|uniref:SusC/RagA family TonB-linked outer membrane protein n=1 Tax=Pedobacter sp. KBW06 TaxID=2153359 RepID=UPI000F5AA829|nr:SusC/RagA family TonB-linked outer membrane protein [Pedobacter sp. KBW06]RQO65256.1 SusC/RagA family TonB-linked outer membrane protein [Pedobacter sp. KBW06]